MAFYHTVPTYVSNYNQVTKIGDSGSSAYKRAVLRDPPKQFKASVLPTKKLGSGWAYGLHVLSTIEEGTDRRSVSSRSTSSRRSRKDYEVWRRWDDCLWFQETLELEYSIQAREKRRRLEQGKGVKKNGVYLNSKRAASFESLPPGPDPTSVSLDIHDYIPKLTKKASLFRANQATIDQRQQQFTEFINAWFAPGLPVLMGELRESDAFRSFFGWWRRDKDFGQKFGSGKTNSPTTPTPTIDSVPFYLDISNDSEFFPSPTTLSPASPFSRPTPTRSATTSDFKRRGSHGHSRDDVSSRRRRATSATTPSPTIAVTRASTAGSHESPPSPRGSLYSAISSSLGPTVMMWDGHEHLNASDRISPNSLLDAFPQTPMVRETFENIQCPPSPEADSPVLGLEPLPEGSELELALSQISMQDYEYENLDARTRGSSVSDGRHRNAVAIPQVVSGDAEISEVPKNSPTMTNVTGLSSRHSLFSNVSQVPSWRTSASDIVPCPSPRRSLESCTTDPVDYSSTGSPVSPQTPWFSDGEALPTLGQPGKRNQRDSVWSINSIASVNSVMSDCSVDQVLPRGGHRRRSKRFVPMSVQEEDVYLEDCNDEILESYLYGIEEMDASAESESDDFPRYQEPFQRPISDLFPQPVQDHSPERTYSPTTPQPPSPREDTCGPPSGRVSMSSTSTVSPKNIAIKAYLTEDIITAFRVPIETRYAEIRDKVYDKFVNQEGISLRPDFPLAYLPTTRRHSATSSVYSGIKRNRSDSVGSASARGTSLVQIQSQEDWEDIVQESEGKLTLRVFE